MNKNLLPITLVVVIFIISGFISFNKLKKTKDYNLSVDKTIVESSYLEELAICSKVENIDTKIKCFENYLEYIDDVEDCKLFNFDSKLYSECINNVSSKSGNLDTCLSLPEEFNKKLCIDESINKQNYSSICSMNYSNQYIKDTCNRLSALYESDSSYCNNIQDKTQKNRCYYNVALLTNNIVLCNNINDQIYLDDCVKSLLK